MELNLSKLLCLLFASPDVLRAIFETLSGSFDMRAQILKQEYDSNTSLTMAMSLLPYETHRERSTGVTKFLIDLMSDDCAYDNLNKEPSYTRYANYTDRLGRTALHIGAMHGLDLDTFESLS